MTRIAIFGAGAIGGYLGLKLHQAGVARVTFIARGDQLQAMRAKGLTLISNGTSVTIDPACTDDPGEAGPQDFVVVTVKSHGLPTAAEQIARLTTSETTLLLAQNGMPYWYFHKLDSPWRDHVIESVDPGGRLWERLPPSQVLGSVVYPAASVVEPGVIRHTHGNQLVLGEADGTISRRAEALSDLFQAAGISAPIRNDIRSELWAKLLGNLAFNPLSVLTGSTLDRMAGRADLRVVARAMMGEAQAVASALGIVREFDIDARIAEAFGVGAHKTSMLQDLERGRPLELQAMLGAVVELGHALELPMPVCEMILTLACERARQSGCFPLDW